MPQQKAGVPPREPLNLLPRRALFHRPWHFVGCVSACVSVFVCVFLPPRPQDSQLSGSRSLGRAWQNETVAHIPQLLTHKKRCRKAAIRRNSFTTIYGLVCTGFIMATMQQNAFASYVVATVRCPETLNA